MTRYTKEELKNYIKTAYFIDSEKYIKERMSLILQSLGEVQVSEDVSIDGIKTDILGWGKPELEGIILYINRKEKRAEFVVI